MSRVLIRGDTRPEDRPSRLAGASWTKARSVCVCKFTLTGTPVWLSPAGAQSPRSAWDSGRGEEDAVSQGLAGGSGRQAACHAMWEGVRGPVGSACRAQEGPVAPLDSKGDTV